MFKIFLYIAIVFVVNSVADEIEWAKDFNAGIEKAQKENKPVLFVFSRHTCKYCVVLEKTTFSDENVIKGLNKDFVSIIAYSDENDAMPRELWRPGTPTIWFLKPNAEPMFQPLMGAVGEEGFLHAMSVVKKEFDKKYTNIKSGK